MTQRQLLIEDAPGKELIPLIKEDGDLDAFREFYKIRRDWGGRPLIHDRFVTYGIFDDLASGLSLQRQAQMLPVAIELASAETDRHFICAVFLISDLIAGLSRSPEQESIEESIAVMHDRARKLSLFPNMSSFWNQIIKRLPNEASRALSIHSDDWKEVISLDLPVADHSGFQNCPGGEAKVREAVAGIKGGEFVLEFKRNAVYEGSKFWIWLYRNVSERPIWHFYVYVVLAPDGTVGVHRHSMHSRVNMSPEELVVKHAYGLIK